MTYKVYPTRAFSELAPSVQEAAITAGKLGFVRMHERFRGVFTSEIVDQSQTAWNQALERVDRLYGTCTCGDSDYAAQCPSFDEHVLVCEYIDQMEESGFSAADYGITLSPTSVEMYSESVISSLNK